MPCTRIAFVAVVSLFALTLAFAQEKVDPKTQALADVFLKVLPEYETSADGFEKALEPFLKSTDPKIVASVDSVRLQILSIRSVRKIIDEQPSYLHYHVSPASLTRWKEGAEFFLAAAKSGRDPFAGATSATRPFRSKIDGQLLPYKIVLPLDYDPAKKYPLHIELHPGAGFLWLAYWVTGKPDTGPRGASNDGAIHITPVGRQHIGMGEVAILEAIADAKKNYSVDENRLIIGGASYGGTGGFHFGTFLPDHFAAAHSLTGGGNYSLPAGNGRYDAYMLADNLANVPFLIWDTPGDGHYKANHAFADELRSRAIKHPGFYANLELTDPKGGHGMIDKKLRDEGEAWLEKQVRNPFPKLAVFKTYWLRYDGAYWAHIDTVEDVTKPARIEAEAIFRGFRVAVENVNRFHLDLDPKVIGDAEEVLVTVNNEKAIKIRVRIGPNKALLWKTAYFWNYDSGWRHAEKQYPDGLIKKHGLSGPIQDAFMEHPVMMVHGEKTTPKMMDDIVDRLISTGDGSGVLRTGFERKIDTDISDKDLAEKNLIVVGTPKQNRFLAKIADKLPVKFLDDGIKIAGKEYRGADVSLAMIYPNPLNPERYILLLPEVYVGTKPLDYPDYVVFQSPKDGKGMARVLAKGSFDARWR